MTRRGPEAWRVVAGVVGLLVVLAILLSTPSMVVAKSVAVVDTELREDGASPQRVLTTMDLGKPDALPRKLGRWNATQQYAWDDVGTLLHANALLSRDYARPGLHQPVNLLILQSANVTSFHPAPVCYRAQGWDVHDDGLLVPVPIPNATWAQPGWISDDAPGTFHGNLTAKALVATKEGDERVALYVYLKKSDWAVTRDVTWIRVEIGVPPGTDPTDAVAAMRDLLGEAVPYMFRFEAGEEPVLGQALLHNYGLLGGLAIVALVSVPSGFIVAGFVRRGK